MTKRNGTEINRQAISLDYVNSVIASVEMVEDPTRAVGSDLRSSRLLRLGVFSRAVLRTRRALLRFWGGRLS